MCEYAFKCLGAVGTSWAQANLGVGWWPGARNRMAKSPKPDALKKVVLPIDSRKAAATHAKGRPTQKGKPKHRGMPAQTKLAAKKCLEARELALARLRKQVTRILTAVFDRIIPACDQASTYRRGKAHDLAKELSRLFKDCFS